MKSVKNEGYQSGGGEGEIKLPKNSFSSHSQDYQPHSQDYQWGGWLPPDVQGVHVRVYSGAKYQLLANLKHCIGLRDGHQI